MKGLFKRGKNWWVRFTPCPGQSQLRFSLDTPDEAKAIVLARDIVTRVTAEAQASLQESHLELENYLRAKKDHGLSSTTLTTRKYVIRSFIEFLGVTNPRAFTRAMVESWFEHHRQRNPHTAWHYLQSVNGWFKWLVEKGKLPINPAAGVQPPKLPLRRRRHFLLPDQARKLLDACDGQPGLKFAIYCGLHAGMRKNEIIEARPDWFDLHNNLIHIQATATFQPKDRDNRSVPLTREFRNWIETSYGLQEPFMLEPKATHGSYRYRYDFRASFVNLTKRCGFPELTFHDLRRTFASLHVSRGTSIYKVARWLGDGVEVVENHYGHLIPQDDEIDTIWSPRKG